MKTRLKGTTKRKEIRKGNKRKRNKNTKGEGDDKRENERGMERK